MLVKLHTIENAGPKQTAIASNAADLLQKAVNHPSFENEFMSRIFDDLWFQKGNSRWKTVSKKEAFNILMTGSELGGSGDNQIDLRVRLNSYKKKTVGVWNGGLFFNTNYYHINKWIKNDLPENLAGHFGHEWSHVCGFRHKGKRIKRDVAYNFGGSIISILNGSYKNKNTVSDHFYDYLECGQQSGIVISPDEVKALQQ